MHIEDAEIEPSETVAPAWHVARSMGVSVKELVATLKSRGVSVVLDSKLTPSFRKSELYALIAGSE